MESVPEIIEALDRAPRLILPLIRSAAPEIVRRRPPSGKWSIHEHACHLAEVHPLVFERLDLMLHNDNPAIDSYDPGRDDPEDALLEKDLDGALDRFVTDRARLVARLREITAEEWRREASHDEYNHYSVFVMFRHVALHDFFHAYRIEELALRRDWPSPKPPSAL